MNESALMELFKTFGAPMAMLLVLGYVFLTMTQKQSNELSETHKWIRETMLQVQRDTSAVVSRCEATMANLLGVLEKREPPYKDKGTHNGQ